MAKLSQGVRKLKNGRYEYRFTVNGKRYSASGSSNKEAVENGRKKQTAIENGEYSQNKNVTLNEYFKEWISDKPMHQKGNTVLHYISFFENHISPALGKCKIVEIESRQVKALQRVLAGKLSSETTNQIIAAVVTILNGAVKDKIIKENPAAGIERVKKKDSEKAANETYHRALDREQQRLFMDEMKNDYYYEMIAFMLLTGVREGEAAALTWDKIDYEKKVIHITETISVSENGKMKIGSPKTKAGFRDIPLKAETISILSAQKAKCNIVGISERNSVFRTPYGNIIRASCINNAIKKALERLDAKGHNIEHFTSHALRDTFATRFLEDGGNFKTLQKLLGHEDFNITMNIYAHALPSTKEEEMNKMQAII